MPTTLETIYNDFFLPKDDTAKLPVEIPNFGRDQLAQFIHQLDFKRLVEVGVRDGEYSEVLAKANPQAYLWGVDPYEPHEGYRDITRQGTFDRYHQVALDRLANYPNYTLLRMYSAEALGAFDDNSLDFVYLDADHCFEEVTFDVVHWQKKLKSGGILAGHDYVKHKGPSKIHVYQAINGYMDAYRLRPWFVLGRQAKVEGEVRDSARSWLWVKP